jgi:prepilin-type N-terminal cleavage/methylation domain-containing protein
MNHRGFTLLELLVVVAILGILAVIAMAQFNAYRRKGFDARANHDLRSAATAEEAYYATNQTYTSGPLATGFLPGFVLSATVSGSIAVVTGTDPSFSGTATSSGGTGKVYSYDSAIGGMLN